jgi:hypothetical protein
LLLTLGERRETRLLHLVLDQLGSRELLGPGSDVDLHLAGCSPDQIRTVATRLVRSLPAGVRLEVTGLLDEGRAVSFTVMTGSGPVAGPVPAHVGRR